MYSRTRVGMMKTPTFDRHVIPRWVGGAVAPERLAESNWEPIKASRRRKARPLEAGRLPRLRALDRSIAEARSKGATAPPFTYALHRHQHFT